jgi:hypothetical protein
MTIFDDVLYYTKGSGGNGVNTVYFVDTTGHACPTGAGLPEPGAPLPISPLDYDPARLETDGLTPDNMCILKGFPTALKSKTSFPFGLWFAGPHTLYVADEGDATNTFSTATGTYAKAAAQTTAGLQKWVGGHVDRERRRGPGRRSEQGRRDHRRSGSHDARAHRGVRHDPVRRVRRGAARRVVHAGHRTLSWSGRLPRGSSNAP